MWHVSSRSGVATLRTAIHLLLTYFFETQHTGSAENASPENDRQGKRRDWNLTDWKMTDKAVAEFTGLENGGLENDRKTRNSILGSEI